MVFTILKIRAIYMYITSLYKKKIHCASYRPPIIQHMVNKWFSKSFICYRTINQGLKNRISRMPSNARRGLRTPKRSPKAAQVAARICWHNEIIPHLITPGVPTIRGYTLFQHSIVSHYLLYRHNEAMELRIIISNIYCTEINDRNMWTVFWWLQTTIQPR